jgi:hypothetical protein
MSGLRLVETISLARLKDRCGAGDDAKRNSANSKQNRQYASVSALKITPAP